jgi:hypothetical protein
MNTKTLITRTVIVFAALAIAGITMAAISQFVMDASQRSILIGVGSAMFGASLCFFLVRFFSIVEK